jgi:DNA-binding NarL/FixJ family response regulator
MKCASKSGNVVNAFVADRDQLLCQLMVKALSESAKGITIRGFATDPTRLLSGLEEKPVDIVILGSDLGGRPGAGFHTLRQLRVTHPRTRVIVLLDSAARAGVIEAFRAGATAVFLRDEPFEMLCKCIHAVYAGQVWASSEQLHFLVEALTESQVGQIKTHNGECLLTKREQELVDWVAEALTNREISRKMGLTEHTVRNYLFRIFNKLGTSNRLELALYVLKEKGLSRLPPALGTPNACLDTKATDHLRIATAALPKPAFRKGN